MSAQATAISNPDFAERQRALALRDSADWARRARAAAVAAAIGEPDVIRASVLGDAVRRIDSVLRELRAMAAAR